MLTFKLEEFYGYEVHCMVWCRNGEMRPDATPCEEIQCKYKARAQDVLAGIRNCRTYQVTLPRHEWNSAVHLELFVKPEKKK